MKMGDGWTAVSLIGEADSQQGEWLAKYMPNGKYPKGVDQGERAGNGWHEIWSRVAASPQNNLTYFRVPNPDWYRSQHNVGNSLRQSN